jgi:hypothetical protein
MADSGEFFCVVGDIAAFTHFDASLAYLMATDKTGHKTKRADAMQDSAFRAAFDQAKALIRDCSVGSIDIDNPLELYGG